MQASTCYVLGLAVAFVFAMNTIFPSVSYAASPSWSEWERANSIAKEGQWLVVRQPNEGFCYIKQGYEGHSEQMDLSMKIDGIPYLTTPFYRGIEGDVSYQVDDGPTRIVPEDKASSLGIKLSSELVPELRRGKELTVRVKPVDQNTLEQKFDLSGFSAASDMLGNSVCREEVSDQYSY